MPKATPLPTIISLSFRSSPLFTFLVGWHGSVVNLPPGSRYFGPTSLPPEWCHFFVYIRNNKPISPQTLISKKSCHRRTLWLSLPQATKWQNKLECLSLASLSSLVFICEECQFLPNWSTFKVLSSRVGSFPYSQIFNGEVSSVNITLDGTTFPG